MYHGQVKDDNDEERKFQPEETKEELGGLIIPPKRKKTNVDTTSYIASKARYVERLMVAKKFRDQEKEIIRERNLLKERENEGGEATEVFVTSAYKKKLAEREQFEKELNGQEEKDRITSSGATTFYKNMIKKGMHERRRRDNDYAQTEKTEKIIAPPKEVKKDIYD